MARYQTTVTSTMSPTEAFNYMAAFENVAIWDPGVRKASRITDGQALLGTRFAVEVSFLGRALPLEYEITAFQAGKSFVLTATTSTLKSVDTVTVLADGQGSKVTYNAELILQGFFKIFDPTLSLAFRSIGNKARDGLRKALNP